MNKRSCVTSASNSWALFAHPSPLGVKVKGSTGRSSHSFATQPPATPTATPIPTSYLNEDDDIVKFTNPAQESTAKDYDVSHSIISDNISVLYDLIEQEFVEVTDFNDIWPFSVTLLPPSQPRVVTKPLVAAILLVGLAQGLASSEATQWFILEHYIWLT